MSMSIYGKGIIIIINRRLAEFGIGTREEIENWDRSEMNDTRRILSLVTTLLHFFYFMFGMKHHRRIESSVDRNHCTDSNRNLIWTSCSFHTSPKKTDRGWFDRVFQHWACSEANWINRTNDWMNEWMNGSVSVDIITYIQSQGSNRFWCEWHEDRVQNVRVEKLDGRRRRRKRNKSIDIEWEETTNRQTWQSS